MKIKWCECLEFLHGLCSAIQNNNNSALYTGDVLKCMYLYIKLVVLFIYINASTLLLRIWCGI